MHFAKALQFILLLVSFIVPATHAIVGDCRYEADSCSCKYGGDDQGLCWDLESGTPAAGTCKSRSCKSGWTCSCADRTHVCPIQTRKRMVINGAVTASSTAPCVQEDRQGAASPILTLGNITASFSKNGLLANWCGEVKWWLNGEVIAEFLRVPTITASNVDQELEDRTKHTLLELKEGDLVAFRFRNASYHCYNGMSEMNVNGTYLDAASIASKTRFARKYTDRWYTPQFTPTLGVNEYDADSDHFVPLRTEFFSTGLPIVAGVDYWRPDDGSRDHEISNFYFRIQL